MHVDEFRFGLGYVGTKINNNNIYVYMANNQVVISLTSIKDRYNKLLLHRTLDRLINLNYDNYVIVLNISKEPKFLDKGFTDTDIKCLHELYPKIIINIVENYGPLRKIIPTLKQFTNNIIICLDDDCIYDKNIISTFVKIYNSRKCIVAGRCRRNCMDANDVNNTITSYSFAKNGEFKLELLPEGVGGILYHSSMFDSKFINFKFNKLEKEFLKNDDLLLRAYTYIKKIPVYCCKTIPYKDNKPKVGLFQNYNKKYIINFQEYINKIKYILQEKCKSRKVRKSCKVHKSRRR